MLSCRVFAGQSRSGRLIARSAATRAVAIAPASARRRPGCASPAYRLPLLSMRQAPFRLAHLSASLPAMGAPVRRSPHERSSLGKRRSAKAHVALYAFSQKRNLLFSYTYALLHALFCTPQNANPSIFKLFRTLWRKTPGWGCYGYGGLGLQHKPDREWDLSAEALMSAVALAKGVGEGGTVVRGMR